MAARYDRMNDHDFVAAIDKYYPGRRFKMDKWHLAQRYEQIMIEWADLDKEQARLQLSDDEFMDMVSYRYSTVNEDESFTLRIPAGDHYDRFLEINNRRRLTGTDGAYYEELDPSPSSGDGPTDPLSGMGYQAPECP